MVDDVLAHSPLDPRPDAIPDALAMPWRPKLPEYAKCRVCPLSPVSQPCRQLGQVVHRLTRFEMTWRIVRVHVPGKECLFARLNVVLFKVFDRLVDECLRRLQVSGVWASQRRVSSGSGAWAATRGQRRVGSGSSRGQRCVASDVRPAVHGVARGAWPAVCGGCAAARVAVRPQGWLCRAARVTPPANRASCHLICGQRPWCDAVDHAKIDVPTSLEAQQHWHRTA